jgi:heterodisulfide reductase subunit C
MFTHQDPASKPAPARPHFEPIFPHPRADSESEMVVKRTVKYEAERVRGFGQEIMSAPGCADLVRCIQCGTCSGTCPLSVYMEHTPRQIMALVRADFKDEVLRTNSIWLCASCYACTVECPREIRITDIMYALKQRAIQEHAYPKHFPIPVLAKEFMRMVLHKGRITETLLVMRLFAKANLRAVLSSWRQGLGLIRTGRFVILHERIERRAELAAMLAAVRNGDDGTNGHDSFTKKPEAAA